MFESLAVQLLIGLYILMVMLEAAKKMHPDNMGGDHD